MTQSRNHSPYSCNCNCRYAPVPGHVSKSLLDGVMQDPTLCMGRPFHHYGTEPVHLKKARSYMTNIILNIAAMGVLPKKTQTTPSTYQDVLLQEGCTLDQFRWSPEVYISDAWLLVAPWTAYKSADEFAYPIRQTLFRNNTCTVYALPWGTLPQYPCLVSRDTVRDRDAGLRHAACVLERSNFASTRRWKVLQHEIINLNDIASYYHR